MNYTVHVLPPAAKQLERLPKTVQKRIFLALAALEIDPRPPGVVKLAGEENLWRIRVGDYRVVYEIQDQQLLIIVVRIGHRKDVYR